MKWLLLCVFLGGVYVVQGRSEEDYRLVLALSTKTALVFTNFTTTTPFTCAFLTNVVACQRRRYKRYSYIRDHGVEGDSSLYGSLAEDLSATGHLEEDVTLEGRDPRVAATLWLTSTSSYTLTITSTNTATTFSLSFFCTINGANFPPACG